MSTPCSCPGGSPRTSEIFDAWREGRGELLLETHCTCGGETTWSLNVARWALTVSGSGGEAYTASAPRPGVLGGTVPPSMLEALWLL